MSAIQISYTILHEYNLVWTPKSHQPSPLFDPDNCNLNTAKYKLVSLRYFFPIYLLIKKHIHV